MIGRIEVTEEILRKIERHAAAQYPAECCGVLYGKADPDGNVQIRDAVAAENASAEKRASVHYMIDPLEWYRLECGAQKQDLELIGIYHSHPEHPAILSHEDEEGMLPGLLYLIVSAYNGQCADLRGYKKDSPEDKAAECYRKQ